MKPRRGATRAKPRADTGRAPRVGFGPVAWVRQHRQQCRDSLASMLSRPVGTAMTVAVIAVALALPGALYIALRNLESAAAGWEQPGRVSLFLTEQADAEATANLADSLEQRDEVAGTERISPEQGLAELTETAGFDPSLTELADNPLPWVIVVTARPSLSQEQVRELVDELARSPQVSQAQFDMEWLIRFNAVADLGRRIVQILAGLLALTVLLVVGNTIRLGIENRRAEIGIVQLVGATRGYVRRPFLYSGVWHGLAGGLTAWLLVVVAVGLLSGVVADLAAAYGSNASLALPGAMEGLTLVGAGTLLGWLGSWVAVGHHLNRPQDE